MPTPDRRQRAPLSVRLPDALERRLRQRAADAGIPVNAILRRAVEEHLGGEPQEKEISR